MASRKTEIIEALFEARWNPDTKELSDPVVSLAEVAKAIQTYNLTHANGLSDKNPANFLKDFIRKKRSANENWPPSVLDRGYTARQVTAGGSCFEFVPLLSGQTEPFPLNTVPPPAPHSTRLKIESASMPIASRRLGRRDEPWLMQVVVRLRIIETHLSIVSTRDVVQVDHLQMSVKLAGTEIDALFLAMERSDDSTTEVIVTCEAKGLSDDILEDQVLKQAKAALEMPGVTQNVVLPMAVKAIGTSLIHVVEFDTLDRATANTAASVSIISEAVYELIPPVPGIGR